MKFDVWTFLFQIVNFAVLLFILKRLLFKPIREIMEKRRKTIDDALNEANERKMEAEDLKKELGEELKRQRGLREEITATMKSEVEEERRKLIETARKEAENIIGKERAVFGLEKKKFEDELKKRAIEAVSHYAGNVLRDASDEILHRSILRKFGNEVKRIASDISGKVRPVEAVNLSLATAYPLDKENTEEIIKGFESSLGEKPSLTFEIDESLIAGVALRVNDRVYDFSLKGQIMNLKTKLEEG